MRAYPLLAYSTPERDIMNICVNTQTPLIRFLTSSPELVEKYGELPEKIDLSLLEEGVDYVFSPGGVTAMVYPSLKRMKSLGISQKELWIALSPGAPTALTGDGIDFLNVDLERGESEAYVRFKDRLWNEIHGLEKLSFVPREYLAFSQYSWKTADLMLKTLGEYDIYYVHDFQQLQIGNFIGPFAPAVFRWHIPANFDALSPKVRKYIVHNMEAFDAIIVSTKRDLEGLFRAGYRGEAYQVYPHIDGEKLGQPRKSDLSGFYEKTGLKEGERFFLTVARMDPIKSQDVVIRAMSHLKSTHPDVKLVLIGNGSFSGSMKSGLGSSKAGTWRKRLLQLIREYGLENSVVLAGHAGEDLLAAAYSLCEAHVLPSTVEGFGLVTPECWHFKRPVIVSSGCGSSEMVMDGLNGYTFEKGDDVNLAEKMRLLLEESGEELGRMGFETGKQCETEVALKREMEIFEKIISLY